MGRQGPTGKLPVWEMVVTVAFIAFMVFVFFKAADNLATMIEACRA